MSASRTPNPADRKSWGRVLVRMGAGFGAVYAGLLGLLFFFEGSLVYPAPRSEGGAYSGKGSAEKGEPFVVAASDGVEIHGVYFPHPDPRHTLVFFHGNAEDLGTSASWLQSLGHVLSANVMMFDYRGYGASQGKPHQAGLVRDGVAAVDWLVQRTGQPSESFLYLGRSLGGGVAVQVAQQRRPLGLVLVSTFDSMVRVASGHFPWLPVAQVMRNRYESAKVLAEIQVPVLQIHGDRDRIVPLARGRALFDAAPPESSRFVTAMGKGHNDLRLEDHLLEISQFGVRVRAQQP